MKLCGMHLGEVIIGLSLLISLLVDESSILEQFLLVIKKFIHIKVEINTYHQLVVQASFTS